MFDLCRFAFSIVPLHGATFGSRVGLPRERCPHDLCDLSFGCPWRCVLAVASARFISDRVRLTGAPLWCVCVCVPVGVIVLSWHCIPLARSGKLFFCDFKCVETYSALDVFVCRLSSSPVLVRVRSSSPPHRRRGPGASHSLSVGVASYSWSV